MTIIRAVFFDMGGTIETFSYDRRLRLEAVPGLRLLLEKGGIVLPLTDEQLLDVIQSGLRRYHQLRMNTLQELPPEQIWREFIFADCPVDPEALGAIAEELMMYFESHFYERKLRPEVPAALAAIRAMGLKIGLISNVSSRGLVHANLKAYGIEAYFDQVVLSSEYGWRKPGPAIFHYAARRIGAPASQCAYVGDRIQRDILGARRAGFGLAVQILHHYAHGEEDEGALPDAVIGRMDELTEILKTILEAPPDHQRNDSLSTGRIKALLFDAGDVLYYRPHKDSRLAAYLSSLGLRIESVTEQQRDALKDQVYVGKMSRDQYQEAQLRLYGLREPEDIARGKQVMDEDDNAVSFFPGVAETLRCLKDNGFFLGIITDTAMPVSVKLAWFEKGGFGQVWDSIVSSYEFGVRKPAPAIYQAALQQLGLGAEQVIFVGHKTSELDGARAVGMHTVAFNADPGASADAFIPRFRDILNLPLLQAASERLPVSRP